MRRCDSWLPLTTDCLSSRVFIPSVPRDLGSACSTEPFTFPIQRTMPFVGEIFSQLRAARTAMVLQEIRDGQITGVTGDELLEMIRKARTFLAGRGLNQGDRCALLAANSIRWVAMDLAIMAEGLIVVPLYFRQAPSELVAMMKNSTPALVCCGGAALRDAKIGRASCRERVESWVGGGARQRKRDKEDIG